jgi:LDH2 family malate/lactate/ureidoglycolate dehydrogenase
MSIRTESGASQWVLHPDEHDRMVEAAYRKRGYTRDEASQAARFCRLAAWHGIKTHNAIKALHLDDRFGSSHPDHPGCVPGAAVQIKPGRFEAAQVWDAHRKLGQAVAFEAIDACERLADRYGVGIVSVDRAFHYLWGGGYVMESARRGYIAYTCCTAAQAEVVPFEGVYPTLGTNPHSWGFPTTDAVGFPIVIDWATSVIAMGRVQLFAREGRSLPPDAAVDSEGRPTTDPNEVAALLPFGEHKGYGLALINELIAAFIGGSLPTLRSRPQAITQDRRLSEKTTPSFFFQVIHPGALSGGAFAAGRDQSTNIKAVIEDVLGHGNDGCLLPGQIEHEAAKRSEAAGGLIFTTSEIDAIEQFAREAGETFDRGRLRPLSEVYPKG